MSFELTNASTTSDASQGVNPAPRWERRRATWSLRLLIALLSALSGGAEGTNDPQGPRFLFREPRLAGYVLDRRTSEVSLAGTGRRWLWAWPSDGSGRAVELGDRVVVRLASPAGLGALLAGSALKLDQTITSNLFVFQAADALSAAREAQRLGELPGVELSHPVRRREVRLHGRYAPKPGDPYFRMQWNLENRDPGSGLRLGPDLNVRAAWPWARGHGVTIGMSDDGVDLHHPDLTANLANTNHFNFVLGTTNGGPVSVFQSHATAVAGLAVAVGDNRRGISGVAPEAQLASWVVFDAGDSLVDEQQTARMFQFRSNVVDVQNHSWGNAFREQLPLGALEDQGIQNAIAQGRGGLGVVIVRSAGNSRTQVDGGDVLGDGNDDGYAQDPRVIAVAAVRDTGRVASYSTPGANVLVAAFSGDKAVRTPQGGTMDYPSAMTTDREGNLGWNPGPASDDLADYAYGVSGFNGTSGAAPQIAGICALLLSANPAITWRDAQQILILASRQTDGADPDIQVNGAGLAVSHNTGFGVPDAGRAVALARAWIKRPPSASVSVTNTNSVAIPDDALRVWIEGDNVPTELQAIPAFPSDGRHPDEPTLSLPLVDVGRAILPIEVDLRGKAALIQRGGNYYAGKIGYALAAGAGFVVLYNNQDGDLREFINGADVHLLSIPTVFIDQNSGNALASYLRNNPDARAQVRLGSVKTFLTVTNTLICEHVALQATFNHPRRADVRLTLVSPSGTRSVLQHFNADVYSPAREWTYYSTHHFFESSAGDWRVEVSDERPGETGSLESVVLTIQGVPIEDSDHDGLDDAWEMAHFGTLALGAADDPDRDGVSNMAEQVLGSNPLAADTPFELDISRWDETHARLSWPALPGIEYRVFGGADPGLPLSLQTEVQSALHESEWFIPYKEAGQLFFRVQTGAAK